MLERPKSTAREKEGIQNSLASMLDKIRKDIGVSDEDQDDEWSVL